ncbi:MAG: hypothetical protein AAGA31_04365 [Bacteroidota bacterium]
MIRPVLLFLLFSLFSACGTNDQPVASTPTGTSDPAPGVVPAAAEEEAGLNSSTLAEYPKDLIDGCDCSLRKDGAAAGTDNDLFFVFNWENGPGRIGINGQEVTVARGASLSTGQAIEDYSSYLHENEQFRIQTSLTKEGTSGEEGGEYSGKVKVVDKESGARLVVNVVGTCSC